MEDVQSLVDSSTRPELEERAKGLGVTGTSRMNKSQLAEAIIERSDEDDSGGTLDEVERQGRAELEQLGQGRTISFLGEELPLRVLVAFAVFIAVFTACWMVLWALLGGIGFGLGWIIAALVAAASVKLATARLAARERPSA